MALDQEYWDERWRSDQTGWDIDGVSPAIQQYIDKELSPKMSILVPGCGSAHEAEYMISKGFDDIHLLDISPTACDKLRSSFDPEKVTVHCGDFFELEGEYDAILEQTFFCALDPTLRTKYVEKMSQILKPKGTLFGLLFDTFFEKEGPPFGGSQEEYVALFSKYFDDVNMQASQDSIAPRAGSEVFFTANLPRP